MDVRKTVKCIIISIVILVLSVPFAMAGGQKDDQATTIEPIELRAVTFGPLTHSNAAPLQKFMDRIEEESDGELVIKYLGATEVTPLYDQPEALRSGVFDILVIFPAAYVGILPIAAGINLGSLDPPEWHASGAHDFLVEVHKTVNMRYLGSFASYDHGSYLFLKNKVSKPEDLAGMKFATGPTNLLAIQAWGGGGVRVPMAEKYSALERGMVDGVAGNLDSHYSDSLYEVTSCWLPYSLGSALTCMLMNDDRWNELPAHLQELVTDVMLELEQETTKTLSAEAAKAAELLQNAGMEIVEFLPQVAENFLQVSLDAKWKDIENDVDPAEVNKLKGLLNR